MKSVAIMWFRRDLRLEDNPALSAAAQHDHVLPLWIDDDCEAGDRAPGAALRVWRHHALASLKDSLSGNLALRRGPAKAVFQELLQEFDVQAVYWNRCYEPWRIVRDTEIKSFLKDSGVKAESFNGSLLWEPWEIRKSDGTPYRVFTPFYRKGCLAAPSPRLPLPRPDGVRWVKDPGSMALPDFDYLPQRPWGGEMMQHWQPGEARGAERLQNFLNEGLEDYKEGRDFPAKPHVSGLSPFLQSGEISPNQVWYAVRERVSDPNADHFCSELGWREFSYSQLWQNPDLHKVNLQSKFDRFQWRQPGPELKAWQKGQTGIPIVDAGMRELWHTGTMHNRVRMIVASFLVKNLLIDWRHGEAWFWDALMDADPASNPASWQWVAGCGADAAPYFRIFNPVTQAKKFDPQGAYIRQWLPELRATPDRWLFAPWEAPQKPALDYPDPIADLKTSRAAALEAFAALRG